MKKNLSSAKPTSKKNFKEHDFNNSKSNPHKKRLILFIMVCIIVLVGIATTYAFFRTTPTGTNEEISLTSGTVSIIFSDGTTSFTGELHFGESATKTFKLENNGSVGTTVNILWDDLVNTYLPQSLSYVLEESDSEDGEYIPITPVRNVPTSADASSQNLASNIYIDKDTTKYYKLTITLNYLDDIDQTQDIKAILSTHFNIKETIFQNGLMASVENDKFWQHAGNIKKVVLEPTMSPKEDATYTYDVSANQNGSVMSYLVPEKDDNTKYTLYIQSDGVIVANPDSLGLFANFTNLESIEGLTNLDTSQVTSMDGMFNNCPKLLSLDLNNFDTSNVTSMRVMFQQCGSLTSLDLSSFDTSNVVNMLAVFNMCYKLSEIKGLENFDTSNVTTMQAMFQACTDLATLDVSKFKTNNVTNMNRMFSSCRKLNYLDLSKFNTSKVTDMSFMFMNFKNIETLDLSSFDTSNVTNMQGMFYMYDSTTKLYESNLIEIKGLENFNTSKVTNMKYMFYGCYALTSLDLSNFNTSSVTDMSFMFQACNSLTSLDLSSFDTTNVNNMSGMFAMVNFTNGSYPTQLNEIKGLENFKTGKVTNMQRMFQNCQNLLELDLSSFDTSNVTNMERMFADCRNLTTLDLSNFNTENVTNMSCMFSMYDDKSAPSKLAEIKGLENFNTSKVTNMAGMFQACGNLSELDLSSFDTSNVTNMEQMFSMYDRTSSSTGKLTSIKGLEKFTTSKVTSMESMFQCCRNITELNLSSFDTSKVTNMSYMFNACNSLKTLNISNFNTENVTTMLAMFRNCTSIEELSLSHFNTNKVTNMSIMFYGCSKLTTLNISGFNISLLEYNAEIFNGVSNLIQITVDTDALKQWIMSLSNLNESNISVI